MSEHPAAQRPMFGCVEDAAANPISYLRDFLKAYEDCFNVREAVMAEAAVNAIASAPQASQPPQGAKPWCSCEPTRCEGIGRCRWQAMNYSPLAASPLPAPQEPAAWRYRIGPLQEWIVSYLPLPRESFAFEWEPLYAAPDPVP